MVARNYTITAGRKRPSTERPKGGECTRTARCRAVFRKHTDAANWCSHVRVGQSDKIDKNPLLPPPSARFSAVTMVAISAPPHTVPTCKSVMIPADHSITRLAVFLWFSLFAAPFCAVSIFYGYGLIVVSDMLRLIALLYMVYFAIEPMQKSMFLKRQS